MGPEMLPIVRVIRARHFQQGILESSDIALSQSYLQVYWLATFWRSRIVPTCQIVLIDAIQAAIKG